MSNVSRIKSLATIVGYGGNEIETAKLILTNTNYAYIFKLLVFYLNRVFSTTLGEEGVQIHICTNNTYKPFTMTHPLILKPFREQ